MLSASKLKKCREDAEMSIVDLAAASAGGGRTADDMKAAIGNWERGLFRPKPKRADVDRLANALKVSYHDLAVWSASHYYAPMAPRKVRLIADLIRDRTVQDALDVLKFANKRAAVMVTRVLESAIANADEQEADVERLYVSEARVDEGGVRQGTRRWRPKDRGRAVSWTRLASHIHVSVDLD